MRRGCCSVVWRFSASQHQVRVETLHQFKGAKRDPMLLGMSKLTPRFGKPVAGVSGQIAAPKAAGWGQWGCMSRVVQVTCFYNAAGSAVAGVSLQGSNGGVNSLCSTTGSPAVTVDVPEGVGIHALDISTTFSGSIVGIVFRCGDRGCGALAHPGLQTCNEPGLTVLLKAPCTPFSHLSLVSRLYTCLHAQHCHLHLPIPTLQHPADVCPVVSLGSQQAYQR